MEDKISTVVALLRESGPAHHQAYIETDGDDPDWPIWYAGYLLDRLNAMLGTTLTKTQLIVLLVELDQQYRSEERNSDWPSYYAEEMMARYG